MANDVNTLDLIDFDEENSTTSTDSPEQNSQNNSSSQNNENGNDADDSVISDYLKTIGIEDSNKIKFDDEDGKTSEKSWKNLTKEEKLNILKTPNVKLYDASDAETYGLDKDETELINYLRENNLTPAEYAQMIYDSNTSAEPEYSYKVDSLSDDELFLADMQLRAKDMTEEELQVALELAKSNPDTYAKQILGLRDEYLNLEIQQNQEKEAEIQAAQLELFNQFSNSVINSIDNLHSIGDLDVSMSDAEKNDLAEFILGSDGAGINHFTKALNDPDTLVAASWFLLNGQEAFSEIQDYISNAVKAAHKAGYDLAMASIKSKNSPEVVVTNPNKPSDNQPINANSIDDINFD